MFRDGARRKFANLDSLVLVSLLGSSAVFNPLQAKIAGKLVLPRVLGGNGARLWGLRRNFVGWGRRG
jgi:hypothetical protein